MSSLGNFCFGWAAVVAMAAASVSAAGRSVSGRTFTRAQLLAGTEGTGGVWRAAFACPAPRPPDVDPFARVCAHAPVFFFADSWGIDARWPNTGWTTIETVVETGCTGRCLGGIAPDTPCVPGSFTVADDRPMRWDFSAGVYLAGYWTHDWAYERIRAESFTPSNRLVRLAAPATFGIGGQTWSEFSQRRFFAYGIRAELDAPGECWYDRAAGAVEYLPPDRGDGAIYGVADTEPILRLVGASDLVYENCRFMRGGGDGIVLVDCTNVVFRNCLVADVAGNGIVISGGRGVAVVSSRIERIGRGGIRVSGGDRRRLVRAGHRVEKCEIADFARVDRTYAPGVGVDGCGVDVVGNLIRDSPHTAILYGGNEHTFVSNEIHSVLLETCDAGAVYTGRDPTSRGNLLAFNYVHDLGAKDARSASTMAFYIDDCDCGDTLLSNRIANVSRGLMLGGGQDNRIVGNAFENCQCGISIDVRGIRWSDRWDSAIDRSWQMTRKVKEMPVCEEPWRSRYPLLVTYLADHPREPRYNPVHGNRFVGCTRHLIMLEDFDSEGLLGVLDIRDNEWADAPGSPSARPDPRIAFGFFTRSPNGENCANCSQLKTKNDTANDNGRMK